MLGCEHDGDLTLSSGIDLCWGSPLPRVEAPSFLSQQGRGVTGLRQDSGGREPACAAHRLKLEPYTSARAWVKRPPGVGQASVP